MRALITGSTERVDALSKAFEQAGAEAVTLADLGPDCAAVDCYVQLGFTVPARGDTVVRRVRSFLSDGLLERFAIVERVLPLLADSATVLLVTGNLSSEGAAPDDRAARLMILRVLAHAIRADRAPQHIRVRVISDERTDSELVEFATTGEKDPLTVPPGATDEIFGDGGYQDWRTEVMGLFQVEV
jgi:hypothetical protein